MHDNPTYKVLLKELYGIFEKGDFKNKRAKEIKKTLRSGGIMSLPFSTNPKRWVELREGYWVLKKDLDE